jgi:hypothetical protein
MCLASNPLQLRKNMMESGCLSTLNSSSWTLLVQSTLYLIMLRWEKLWESQTSKSWHSSFRMPSLSIWEWHPQRYQGLRMSFNMTPRIKLTSSGWRCGTLIKTMKTSFTSTMCQQARVLAISLSKNNERESSDECIISYLEYPLITILLINFDSWILIYAYGRNFF